MKKAYVAGLLAWLLTGCFVQLPPPFATTPRVSRLPPGTMFVVTPAPSETPAICTPLPVGAQLTITPLSATQVQLALSGMQPGEQLGIHFISHPAPQGNWREMSEWTYDRVKTDGSYTTTWGSLEPARGSTVNAWLVKVTHARGVACQEFILDMP